MYMYIFKYTIYFSDLPGGPSRRELPRPLLQVHGGASRYVHILSWILILACGFFELLNPDCGMACR